jgi:hypothetical protein
MQVNRRTTAPFKFFATSTRAGLVATYLGAHGLGGLSLGNGMAQRQPIGVYLQHAVFNSIAYLGGNEQVNLGWKVLPTPPHASEGPNYHFICRAHAYAIDPAVAKNLLAHVIKYGICAPLDILIRSDVFPIHQMGVYAYDVRDGETTILNRPTEGRTTKRNDNLED